MGGIFTVTLPDIGEGVVEGEVIEWLKAVGDSLEQDEPVVVVMTDKATVELPAPNPGKLLKQYFQVGEKAIRDLPLYDIEVEEIIEQKKQDVSSIAPSITKEKKEGRSVVSTGRPLATPAVRNLARKLKIDLHQVKGSGNDGRIMPKDLKGLIDNNKAGQSSLIELPGDREEPLVGIPKLMAEKMAESNRKIPHFSYFEQVDATRLIQLRNRLKEQSHEEGIHLTFLPFIIRALSLTLKKFPAMNGSIDMQNHKIVHHEQQNIGVAMSTKFGLIVPVLKSVEGLTLRQLVEGFEGLKERALTGKLKTNEMKESTITVSNFGVLGGGGLFATPIINPPEVAILALNKIQKQPVIKNGQVIVGDVLNLSWSFDHRIIDGDLGATFSHHFAQLLQNPASLL